MSSFSQSASLGIVQNRHVYIYIYLFYSFPFCLPYCHRLAKRYNKLLFGVFAVFYIGSLICDMM